MAQKKGSKARVVIILAAVFIAAAVGAFFLLGGGDPAERAGRDAAAYVQAVEKRDFEAVFNNNANAQKRKAIMSQRSADKEGQIKALFADYKAAFEALEPTSDLRAQWVEKWLFVPGVMWRVTKVETFLDTENPSQPASDRLNALVTVQAEYPDRNTAPDLNGKVKSAEYLMTMIQGRNVSRILREEVRDNRWLFNSVSVNRETIQYWPEGPASEPAEEQATAPEQPAAEQPPAQQ